MNFDPSGYIAGANIDTCILATDKQGWYSCSVGSKCAGRWKKHLMSLIGYASLPASGQLIVTDHLLISVLWQCTSKCYSCTLESTVESSSPNESVIWTPNSSTCKLGQFLDHTLSSVTYNTVFCSVQWSEHFTYLNISWSQHVWITDCQLYSGTAG